MSLQIYDDIEQQSPEWHEIRSGIPTASNFQLVFGARGGAEKVGREKYLSRLAYEVVTGKPGPEGYKSAAMARGNEMEDDLRALYCLRTNAEVKQVGFVRNGQKGCSPDGLIGNDGMLEIKSAQPDVLIPLKLKGEFPLVHRAQVQGSLWVAEREWCDLTIGWPPMELTVRAYRDEMYIRQLADAVDAFNAELSKLVETLRRM